MFGKLMCGLRTVGGAIAPKLPVVGLVTGLLSIGAGVGLAIYETYKYGREDKEELDDKIAEINAIHDEEVDEAPADKVERLEKTRKKEIRKAKRQYIFRCLKHHVKSAIAIAVGATLILTAFGLLRRTCAKLTATVGTLTGIVETYRQRAEENNPGSDFNNVWGTTQQDVEVEEVDENGVVHKVKYENANVISDELGIASPYARVFNRDTAPTKFDPNDPGRYNDAFITGIQQTLNNDLPSRKYITLNEAYRKLGMEECQAGEDMGWAKNLGDGVVDFRLNRIFKPNGDGTFETILVIDPNVTDITPNKKWRRKF